jgi:ubiquinone biosynthesis protein
MMIPPAFPLDPQALAAIVPDGYAAFRPLVTDGLLFFVNHLSAARLAELLRAQAALPADAALARRLVLLLHSCPALHKVGQVLARDRRLDPELRRHLQELESLEPHTPAGQLRPILERELAAAAREFDIRASEGQLAEGSVAVVVPLTWADPADGAGACRRHGVAKVLKPGAAEKLGEDLEILGRLAGYLETRWAAYGLPPLPYQEILAEVADLLTHEVDLRQEQAHLRLARQQLARQSDVLVPRVLPFCTDHLTAMERVFGWKVTDPRAVSAWRRPALFLATARALLSGVLFSRDPSVLFHGDPHAGNLMVTHDGRLATLDWSLAGRLTTDDRVRVSQILLGGWARDAAQVAAAVAGLARDADEELIHRRVAAELAGWRGLKPPGLFWVIDLLDTLTHAGVRFPPRLLLFRKGFLTLQGVLSDVCPCCSLEATLTAEALTQLAWEWPARWVKPPDDRDYGTHVSSADLLDLTVRAPAALAQGWKGFWSKAAAAACS